MNSDNTCYLLFNSNDVIKCLQYSNDTLYITGGIPKLCFKANRMWVKVYQMKPVKRLVTKCFIVL